MRDITTKLQDRKDEKQFQNLLDSCTEQEFRVI